MVKLVAVAPAGKGSVELEESPLGRGGEGSVHSVSGMSGADFLPPAGDLVAKLYHDGHGEKNKIRAMLLSPPDSDSVAWPLAALFDGKTFKGFLMKKLDFSSNRPWSELAHSGDRRKTADDFDVMYALTTVRNFAVALDDVHAAGHHVGDINESNMFVGDDAQVMLVDTDSAQVSDPKTGAVFSCLVGKPEYTASEISHGKLKDQERTVATDIFGFSVAAYQMILGGPHPTDGVFQGKEDPPPVIEKIRSGIYPALQGGKTGKFTAPPRVAVSGIPSRVRKTLLAGLDKDPQKRPTLDEMIDVFDDVSDNLTQCENVAQHWFDSRDKKCGWCLHADKTGIDPWSVVQEAPAAGNGRKPKNQRQLSGVNFADKDSSAPKAQRMPPQQAGSPSGQPPVQTPHGNSPGGPVSSPAPGPQTQSPQQAPYPGAGYQGGPPGQQHPQQSPYPPQNYEPPTQKELKKRFKTKKTVLSYADGTYGIRPQIGELLKNRPKLALSCLRDETPSYAAFWWSNRKAVPVWYALILGNMIAAFFALLWWTMMPEWLNLLAESLEWDWKFLGHVFTVNTYTAVIGVSITSVWMTISGLIEDVRYKRRYKSLKEVNKENPLLTFLRYVSISVVWGPILMVGTVVGLVLLALNLIIEVIRNGDSR